MAVEELNTRLNRLLDSKLDHLKKSPGFAWFGGGILKEPDYTRQSLYQNKNFHENSGFVGRFGKSRFVK
jgi:hypothetical protein